METTKWNVQDELKTPEDCAAFIRAAMAEADDDPAFLAIALGEVARSAGMAKVARDAGISREGLYKAVAPDGNPSFVTMTKILGALGLRLTVEAAATPAG